MLSLPQETSIDVSLLEKMQEENIVTSYKLFWFRGIFKEIINQNKDITFRRIVCRIIAEAWYPLIEYHLNYGAIDRIVWGQTLLAEGTVLCQAKTLLAEGTVLCQAKIKRCNQQMNFIMDTALLE